MKMTRAVGLILCSLTVPGSRAAAATRPSGRRKTPRPPGPEGVHRILALLAATGADAVAVGGREPGRLGLVATATRQQQNSCGGAAESAFFTAVRTDRTILSHSPHGVVPAIAQAFGGADLFADGTSDSRNINGQCVFHDSSFIGSRPTYLQADPKRKRGRVMTARARKLADPSAGLDFGGQRY